MDYGNARIPAVALVFSGQVIGFASARLRTLIPRVDVRSSERDERGDRSKEGPNAAFPARTRATWAAWVPNREEHAELLRKGNTG